MTLFAAKTKRQAEKAEPQTKTRRKLTRAERKQIEAAIARANRTDKKEQSAQDSIPYERMWPDGICKVADGRYTKTIQFQDINYQLSQNEDKAAIFEGWCDFLNYFDSSIRFQLSFLNLAASQETFANSITIPPQYHLEDQLLKTFPEEIEKNKGFITGLEADMKTLAEHPHPEDGFAGMEVRGDTLTDKENAGAALLDACKEVKGTDPVPVGSYRGFAMSVSFDAFRQEYMLLLKGQMTHRATLGTDPRGNLTRIDNALSQMPQRLEAVKNQLDNLYQQQAAAKAEVGKPFPQEQELRDKSARLAELDVLLNMDGRGRPAPEAVLAKSSRPSVLEGLKRPVPPRCPEKKPKHPKQEVR